MKAAAETVSARQLLQAAVRRLQAAGKEPARHEAEWLLSRLLGEPSLALYLQDPSVSPAVAERFESQIEARASGMPLQYLAGEAEFFGEPFLVRPGVFIPRPETEAIVEAALRAFRALAHRLDRPLQLLELGTGSGCIAVTLARALPACHVTAVELSWDALHVAQENILRHEVGARVHLVQSHWVGSIRGTFDGMVANPPYVPSAQVARLPFDVRQEPRLSLDGGVSGLRDLLHLLADAPRRLRLGGVLALECGEEQVEPLRQCAAGAAWVLRAEPLHDLAARPRGMLITRRASP